MEYKDEYCDPMFGVAFNLAGRANTIVVKRKNDNTEVPIPIIIQEMIEMHQNSDVEHFVSHLNLLLHHVHQFNLNEIQMFIESNLLTLILTLLTTENPDLKLIIVSLILKLINLNDMQLIIYLIRDIEIHERLILLLDPANENIIRLILRIVTILLNYDHNLSDRYIRCLNPEMIHYLLVANIPSQYEFLYESTVFFENIFEYFPNPNPENSDECDECRDFIVGFYQHVRDLLTDFDQDRIVCGFILISAMFPVCTSLWIDHFLNDEQINNAIVIHCDSSNFYLKQKALSTLYSALIFKIPIKEYPLVSILHCLTWNPNNTEEEDLQISKMNHVSCISAKLLDTIILQSPNCIEELEKNGLLQIILEFYQYQTYESKPSFSSLIASYVLMASPKDNFLFLVESDLRSYLFNDLETASDEKKSKYLDAITKLIDQLENVLGNKFIENLQEDEVDALEELTDNENQEISAHAQTILEKIENYNS